jgi:hypothetical protein
MTGTSYATEPQSARATPPSVSHYKSRDRATADTHQQDTSGHDSSIPNTAYCTPSPQAPVFSTQPLPREAPRQDVPSVNVFESPGPTGTSASPRTTIERPLNIPMPPITMSDQRYIDSQRPPARYYAGPRFTHLPSGQLERIDLEPRTGRDRTRRSSDQAAPSRPIRRNAHKRNATEITTVLAPALPVESPAYKDLDSLSVLPLFPESTDRIPVPSQLAEALMVWTTNSLTDARTARAPTSFLTSNSNSSSSAHFFFPLRTSKYMPNLRPDASGSYPAPGSTAGGSTRLSWRSGDQAVGAAQSDVMVDRRGGELKKPKLDISCHECTIRDYKVSST